MSKPEIAVIVHLYWVDLWDELAQYLNNIVDPYDLYVTVTTDSLKQPQCPTILNKITTMNTGGSTKILVIENRGMDIGGLFMVMRNILLRGLSYKYYLKLHSKKSLEARKDLGREWRTELIRPLCKDKSSVSNCLNLLKIGNTGMVGAKKWVLGAAQYQTFLPIINAYLQELKICENLVTARNFVGGTMFWVNGEVLEDLFNRIHIAREYSRFSYGKITDGAGPTLEHAFERLLGIVVGERQKKVLSV